MKRSRLTRKTPLKSGDSRLKRTRLDRTKPLKSVNRKRKDREWKRAYGSEDRVRWVKQLNCLVCGAVPSENAHIETGGTGRKADADRVVPLCAKHHTDPEHGYDCNKATFEATHGLDLQAEAEKIEARWQRVLAEEVDCGF